MVRTFAIRILRRAQLSFGSRQSSAACETLISIKTEKKPEHRTRGQNRTWASDTRELRKRKHLGGPTGTVHTEMRRKVEVESLTADFFTAETDEDATREEAQQTKMKPEHTSAVLTHRIYSQGKTLSSDALYLMILNSPEEAQDANQDIKKTFV
ncbi:hypothetical protein CPAR01_05490 [Colletotrichum paranaense]|uniref:Uncharacterized protein n=1 Tax=Colletotrichum paranaense TaxID=1914294 RepID=A0ABQ9SRE7_9PEZI|nr:uncharacterized protein CPAR01_05490 [Colletotrichum paranaense]KAK1542103.1 hypothetical protein CPAR01_05490 [Colletotrichum paranaense]